MENITDELDITAFVSDKGSKYEVKSIKKDGDVYKVRYGYSAPLASRWYESIIKVEDHVVTELEKRVYAMG